MAMVDIILTKEQAAAITRSNGRVRFVSEDGAVSAVAQSVVRPVDWNSLSEADRREILRRLESAEGSLLSTEELIDRLQKRFPE
jgi:hypothetical protein